jgi:hypothetical protein
LAAATARRGRPKAKSPANVSTASEYRASAAIMKSLLT